MEVIHCHNSAAPRLHFSFSPSSSLFLCVFLLFCLARMRFSFNMHGYLQKTSLKITLATLPIFSKLDPAKKLIVYYSVSIKAISAVLVQEEGCERRPVYFVSQVLQDPKMRYQVMEKVALALVNVTRYLQRQFQSHKITAWTECPIARILHKLVLGGRMMTWSIELSEYDIAYKLRGTIRAQVLANFINEFHPPPPYFKQEWWTMHV